MNMKHTGLFLTFLMCIATVNGFGQETNFVPLTWWVVSNVRNKLNELDYYLSRSFPIKIPGQDNVDKINVSGGKLVPGEKNLSPEIKFTTDDKGKLDNIFDALQGREVLEISFQDKGARLRFARNINKDRFELVSAMINANNYTLRFPGEPPYLIVQSQLEVHNTEARSVPIIYINGQGSLNKSTIIKYIMLKNPNISERSIENLIDAYLWEAGKEGINHDIAIAQMCRTTYFLSNRNIMQTYNYAGFTSTPEWSGRFYGMKQGVTAHIQHLKGYTSNVGWYDLKEPLADPRWNMLNDFRGTIHTLEDLSKMWAPYNAKGYETDIKNIINEMRWFSSR